MDTTLLRKLSRKSTLKFGMYADNTVQELLIFKTASRKPEKTERLRCKC